jgi:hypothetical protein
MTPEKERAFPFPEEPPSKQDKKRTLVGLWKMEPLETVDEFAERVAKALRQQLRQHQTGQ